MFHDWISKAPDVKASLPKTSPLFNCLTPPTTTATNSALSCRDALTGCLVNFSKTCTAQAERYPVAAYDLAKMTAARLTTVLNAEETFVYSTLTTSDSLRLLNVRPGPSTILYGSSFSRPQKLFRIVACRIYGAIRMNNFQSFSITRSRL
jgi:hypothetical protein